MIPNIQKITEVKYKYMLTHRLPVNHETYNSVVSIRFAPDKFYPHYKELEKDILFHDRELLTPEEVVKAVADILQEYKPYYVRIKSLVRIKDHPEFTIIKEYRDM